ncbi:MAG: hypothetical protein ABIK85_08465, partial [Candidatus Eisenbacteria bacterium]
FDYLAMLLAVLIGWWVFGEIPTPTVISGAAIVIFAGAAAADGVTDAIAAAGGAYGSGDLKEASTQLQTALAAVNQQLIEQLIGALPDPPAGWTAQDPDGIDASAVGAGYFATLFVSRIYETPEGSRIELTVSANSPMLMSLRMFISNPMMASMAGQTGMKKVSACGYDAIEHFGDGTFETHVLGGDATLISFDGSQASDEERIRTLVSATDCKTIVGIVE